MKSRALKFFLAFLVPVLISGCTTAIAPSKDQLSLPKTEEKNIKVATPLANAEVSSPLTVTGEARVFENQLNYELLDEDSSILAQGSAYANSPDIGQFGPFEIKIDFTAPKGKTGTLNIFDSSPKDGSRIDEVKIPVKFIGQ